MTEKESSGVGSEKAAGGSLPLHLRILGIFFDEIDRSIPTAVTGLKDMQAIYLSGMRIAFKAAHGVEKWSKVNIRVSDGLGRAFENIVPVVMKAQLEAAEAVAASTRGGIKALRKNLMGHS